MSRYAQALGIMKFTVGGMDFSLKPRKGDNLRLMELQRKSEKDKTNFAQDAIPFIVELIARDENIEKGTQDYEELELFVELHALEIVPEIIVGFKWTTREKLQAAQEEALKGFQKQLGA